MKYFGLVIIALLALMSSANAQHSCDRMAAFKHTTATGPIEIVSAVSDQRIYFCGFTIAQRGPTLDMIVSVGTGTNCDTNTIVLTPQLEFPNDFALSSRQESVGPHSEPGYAMCLQTLGAGKLGGILYYAQF